MEDYLQDCRAALQVTGPVRDRKECSVGSGKDEVWDLGRQDGRCGGITEVAAGSWKTEPFAHGRESPERSLFVRLSRVVQQELCGGASLARAARCVCPFLPAPQCPSCKRA